MSAPKYKQKPRPKLDIQMAKKEAELLRYKLSELLKDKKNQKKAALIIEEMMNQGDPKKKQKD